MVKSFKLGNHFKSEGGQCSFKNLKKWLLHSSETSGSVTEISELITEIYPKFKRSNINTKNKNNHPRIPADLPCDQDLNIS